MNLCTGYYGTWLLDLVVRYHTVLYIWWLHDLYAHVHCIIERFLIY